MFTPRKKNSQERYSLTLSPKDEAKVKRGYRWVATVTDIPTQQQYSARGASCGSSGCYCDAIAEPLEAK